MRSIRQKDQISLDKKVWEQYLVKKLGPIFIGSQKDKHSINEII